MTNLHELALDALSGEVVDKERLRDSIVKMTTQRDGTFLGGLSALLARLSASADKSTEKYRIYRLMTGILEQESPSGSGLAHLTQVLLNLGDNDFMIGLVGILTPDCRPLDSQPELPTIVAQAS